MPLEIKELYIKVAVSPPEGGATGPSPAASAANGSAGVNQDEIIAAVVEQVLQILQEKKEA